MRKPRCVSLRQRVLVVAGSAHPFAPSVIARAAAKGAYLVLIDFDQDRVRRAADEARRAGTTVVTPSPGACLRDEVTRAFGTLHAWINVGDDAARTWTDVAVAAFGPDGGTLVNVGPSTARVTARARRRARELKLPVNVCLVRAAEHLDPGVVAHSTLGCLRHPRREVTIGAATHVLTALDLLLPARTKSKAWITVKRLTLSDREALRLVTRGERVPRKSNLYAALIRHPWTSLAVAGAATLFFGSQTAHAPTTKGSGVNT